MELRFAEITFLQNHEQNGSKMLPLLKAHGEHLHFFCLCMKRGSEHFHVYFRVPCQPKIENRIIETKSTVPFPQ